MKGTGFSPYVKSSKINEALALDGMPAGFCRDSLTALRKLGTNRCFEGAPQDLSSPSPPTNPSTHSFQTTCAATLLHRISPSRSILISNAKTQRSVIPTCPLECLLEPVGKLEVEELCKRARPGNPPSGWVAGRQSASNGSVGFSPRGTASGLLQRFLRMCSKKPENTQGIVKGHGFSRAANATKQRPGFSPWGSTPKPCCTWSLIRFL